MSGGPRNRLAFNQSQRARAAIREAWLELIRRQPFKRYSARHVLRGLSAEFASLPERTVQWHMQQITMEAEEAELPCGPRNSSAVLRPVG